MFLIADSNSINNSLETLGPGLSRPSLVQKCRRQCRNDTESFCTAGKSPGLSTNFLGRSLCDYFGTLSSVSCPKMSSFRKAPMQK